MKKDYYVMMKRSIHQENRTIANSFSPLLDRLNILSKYKQIDGQKKDNTITEDFNILLLTVDRSSREKIKGNTGLSIL